jgi:hypothetical protein
MYGQWSQLETLLHEMLHLKQQKYGLEPYKGGKVSHNREFVELGKVLGLNIRPGVGSHMDVADEGSPFAILMKELGIERPADVPRAQSPRDERKDYFRRGEQRPGRSTLTSYQCGCGEKIRVGKKEWPGAVCKNCGSDYRNMSVAQEIVFKAHKREVMI